MTEPYYRDYFAGDAQAYAPARTIYGENTGDNGPQSATTYEGRFSNHSKNTPVYNKAVTAAGLTVDLPSPDSGIGTDAITPRDQNSIQQVCVSIEMSARSNACDEICYHPYKFVPFLRAFAVVWLHRTLSTCHTAGRKWFNPGVGEQHAARQFARQPK